jgi:hypothetical protein
MLLLTFNTYFLGKMRFPPTIAILRTGNSSEGSQYMG